MVLERFIMWQWDTWRNQDRNESSTSVRSANDAYEFWGPDAFVEPKTQDPRGEGMAGHGGMRPGEAGRGGAVRPGNDLPWASVIDDSAAERAYTIPYKPDKAT